VKTGTEATREYWKKGEFFKVRGKLLSDAPDGRGPTQRAFENFRKELLGKKDVEGGESEQRDGGEDREGGRKCAVELAGGYLREQSCERGTFNGRESPEGRLE